MPTIDEVGTPIQAVFLIGPCSLNTPSCKILSGCPCSLRRVQTPIPRVKAAGHLTSLLLFIFQFHRSDLEWGLLSSKPTLPILHLGHGVERVVGEDSLVKMQVLMQQVKSGA